MNVKLWHRLRPRAGRHEPNHPDRLVWGQANTLPEVARLCARWWDGTLTGPAGTGRELVYDCQRQAPGSAAAAAGLCRAGLVVWHCDPAPEPAGGRLPAVFGFGDAACWYRLATALDGTGVDCYSWLSRPRWRRPVRFHLGDTGLVVPELGARDIATMWSGCPDPVVDELVAARQIVVVDPTPSSSSMWPLLAAAARQMIGDQAACDAAFAPAATVVTGSC